MVDLRQLLRSVRVRACRVHLVNDINMFMIIDIRSHLLSRGVAIHETIDIFLICLVTLSERDQCEGRSLLVTYGPWWRTLTSIASLIAVFVL